MGYAKYHEDDFLINEDRMYYRNTPDTLSVVRKINQGRHQTFLCYCPFCNRGFMSGKDLQNHVFSVHGGKYNFVYLNNKRIDDLQYEVSKVYSLKLYCFYEESQHIIISDDFDRKYHFDTVQNKYEYDLTSVLCGKIFSHIKIEILDQENIIEIVQCLDIEGASIDNILQNRYVSRLFDMQISNNLLHADECLIYLKMLINEKTDALPFVRRLESFHFDYSRDLTEVVWYYSLYNKKYDCDLLNDKEGKQSLWIILYCLLNGEYEKADELLQKERRRDNDAIGLRIIHAMLMNDQRTYAYNKTIYEFYGIIGNIIKVLEHIHDYEKNVFEDIKNDIKELYLFGEYPLIHALLDYYKAEREGKFLDKNSYDLLRSVSASVSVLYCRGINDRDIINKILKSNTKLHPDSQLLKSIALEYDFSWIGNRISVRDTEVYKRKLQKENEEKKCGFSSRFLDVFPYDDEIIITSLGGEKGIGASCFVISYQGFNIMLDVGVNPKKTEEDSYPSLDAWNGRIDLILLSHAHIDHSGGVPKAHAMWNDARILMTRPTKTFLKYIYLDMAKIKNGIVDDFEIENVNITREVMESTFNAISTIDYEDVIRVREDIEICFHKAGHIVGAAMIELRINGKVILYTGDFTEYDQNLIAGMNIDNLPRNIDYLITEATYLSRKNVNRFEQAERLKAEVKKAIELGKSILLSGASIGRSQELICILGEMLEDGEIPSDYIFWIAGMAIPTSTQLIPFFNEEYESLLKNFLEVDSEQYPKEKSIVVASSGTLKKGSASYKIEKYWKNYGIKHTTIMGGYADEDTEYDCKDELSGDRMRMSLSTHASRNGIHRLISYVQPKVVSIVHCSASKNEVDDFILECKTNFENDILFIELKKEEECEVFNVLKQIM